MNTRKSQRNGISPSYMSTSVLALTLAVALYPLHASETSAGSSRNEAQEPPLQIARRMTSEFIQQLASVQSLEEADALAQRISESLRTEGKIWESLRREGFMEVDIFWDKTNNKPTFLHIIKTLKERKLWTNKLAQAHENWHARLGHHISVWTNRHALRDTELAWLRQDLAHELRLFREQRSQTLGAGDALSQDTPLLFLSTDEHIMHKHVADFVNQVGKCGMANYAIFTQEEEKQTRYILHIYGIHRESGEGHIFYFDVSQMIRHKQAQRDSNKG